MSAKVSRRKSAPKTGDERLVFSVEEAGRLLGLSRGTAYLAAQTGALPTVRIGRRLLVPKVALESLLASPRTRPATEVRHISETRP
jgi:excisionase family DNA binding protein